MSKLLLKEFFPMCSGDNCNLQLLTEEERKFKDDGFMILTGILQRANFRNQNGRIYKKHILEREMNNYQKVINEKRSFGECVEEGARILTKGGWKDFKDLVDNEYVYTINMNTKKIESQRIIRKIEKEYNSYLYHFKNRNIDIKVTPNHQFFLIDRYGQNQVVTAEDIYNNRLRYSHSYIPKTGTFEPPESRDFFTLMPISVIKGTQELKEKYSHSVQINMEVWMAFLGFYLAEGHCGRNKNENNYTVCITQNEGSRAERFRKILAGFPKDIIWKERHKSGSENGIIFYTIDKRLHTYLKQLGNKYNKFIPIDVKMLDPKYLRILLDWFILGDGRRRSIKNREQKYYVSNLNPETFSVSEKMLNVAIEVFSVSRKLVEDLQEIALKSGFSGNIHIRPAEQQINGGFNTKIKNAHDLYILHLSTTKGISLKEKSLKIDKVLYSGKVYCVETPNSTFYCENKGKTFWSHNCDHSNDAVVNLKNVSHMILRIWWDNDDLMGVLKVLKTPSGAILEGIIHSGGTIGISSRALGSLQETPQGNIVGEDLEIICYDAVSQPSVQNAYLHLNESKIYNRNEIFSKADRINRALNNILKG